MITTDAMRPGLAMDLPAETPEVEIHNGLTVGHGRSDGAVLGPDGPPRVPAIQPQADAGVRGSAWRTAAKLGPRRVAPGRPTGALRILITGSRSWTDKAAVGQAICWAIGEYAPHLIVLGEHGPRLLWDQITVVHGAARGADTIADRIARAWGMRVDPHPVTSRDWETCAPDCDPQHRRARYGKGTYCPTAGNRRNQRMVDLGADVCLGFPAGPGWSGARDCMTKAAAAGIRVIDWPAESKLLTDKVKL